MATQHGSVTLAGRFPKGTHVKLTKVKDESVLRPEGGKLVATGKVDEDGRVQFKNGVEVGARYFVSGYVDGFPVDVRVRGNRPDDDTVLAQPPVRPDRTKLSDGSFADEVPERRATPDSEVGPAPGQDQVPAGTQQRSDTPRGTAHPIDVKEQVPYPRQEDVPKGTPQMSDTATGQATPIVQSVARQEDVPDSVKQRSDTERGTAAVLPKGDAVQAQQDRESSAAKASRGEPVKAAAAPLDPAAPAKAKRPKSKKAATTASKAKAAAKKPAKKK